MLTEKSSEKQRDLYICCIDYVKAEMGDWVDMQEGGRQGCILSPIRSTCIAKNSH